jgi:hypothetical protein
MGIMAAIALALAQPAAQSTPQRFELRVVVYDYAGVPKEVLEQAQHNVSGLFGSMGVDAVWLNVQEFTNQIPGDPAARRAYVASVSQVKLVSPAMHRKLGLKNSDLGAANSATRSAWISVQNVRMAAKQARVNWGDALGYVIAHEIGHLLLPAGSHSGTGIMREHLEPQLVLLNRLAFLSEEASLIRAALAAVGTTAGSR